jgi:hypothetical protein
MPPHQPWDPALLPEVCALFSALRTPWWIAGGHAIELAVGHCFREHSDIDVLLLRRDQLAVQQALRTWELWAADPPGTLRPWQPGEFLPIGVHDIWCRPGPSQPWRIQVMLDEAEGGDWVSRRSTGVRRAVERVGAPSATGVPYLTPEIQLFYKAKQPRPKDEQDFAEVLPSLTTTQRHWLADAISATYGDHPWTGVLK